MGWSSRVSASEFQSLVELADVVLDPFPVGGGRSSLEIFAVGTPIVMLYNRTSILQVRGKTTTTHSRVAAQIMHTNSRYHHESILLSVEYPVIDQTDLTR